MSFTIACNTLLSQWLMPPDESIRQTLGKHNLFQVPLVSEGREGMRRERIVNGEQ